MKIVIKIILFLFFSLLLVYVIFPSPEFPSPMKDFSQSGEPADIETPLRRAYYTNATRAEVMDHYLNKFGKSSFLGLSFLTYRLNYPPEEALTLVRDQTKSTFLEEIVHPLRESIYINGFEPLGPEYAIIVKGVPWRQKITVRFVPSSLFVRIVVVLMSCISTYFLLGAGRKKLK